MASWKNTAEVAIIGGGIMGVATAFYLAERGIKDVVLLEKDLVSQGSTGLSVGGIRQQFSHPANIRLSRQSVRVFGRFREEFGIDIGYHKAGYLFLAGKEETWRDFLASVETQRRLGVPVEILDQAEILSRWPYLNVSDVRGGTFCAEDGYADPYLVAMGFARSARSLGVRIEELTRVTAIRLKGDRIAGVATTRGAVQSPVVVNAAGPWAAEIGRMAAVELPVLPYRRQAFMTQPFDVFPKPVPMIIDQDATFYFRGADPGLIMGMSDPDEPSSFHLQTDREFMERVVEAAVHRAPQIESARILRGWAGLYEVTPDDNPIIGPIPTRPGFFCAVGFSGHGFQHGPAVGQIMSRLIAGERGDFDLEPFSYERFSRPGDGGERRVV
ncbi:MAG TPA: FAD-binding oxidoreductase [Candidatus Desulfaltia sp.]|nr:FAD-binding oxidoreductase [Candidatus Desulfaltia sp.]